MVFTMAKIQRPAEFDFTRPSEWPKWRDRYTRYAIASKVAKEEGEIRVNDLVYTMGSDAEPVIKSFKLTEAQKNNYEYVLGKLNTYFVPKVNVIHERAVFNERVQEPNETVEAFVRALYVLSGTCNFGEGTDDRILDRLVVGILDKDVSKDLQLKAELTLADAISTARQAEHVNSQMSARSGSSSTSVEEVKTGDKFPSGPSRPPRGRGRGSSSRDQPKLSRDVGQATGGGKTCKFCKGDHPFDKRLCPARRATCHRCSKKGHYASCCPENSARSRQKVREVAVPSSDDDSYDDDNGGEKVYFVGAVNASKDLSDKPWEVKLRISRRIVPFKLDSGADVTIMTEKSYRQLRNPPKLSPTDVCLVSVGSRLKCSGKFVAKTMCKGTLYKLDIYVVQNAKSNLLSRRASQVMGFLTVALNEASRRRQVYGDIGLMKCPPIRIKLKPEAVPYNLTVARRVPLPLRSKVKEELARMERNGVIMPVTEATDWCSPMVPVLKKSGKVRICVDLKRLNQVVMRERYVLPTLEEILPKLSGSKVFSTLDCSSGFWAIPLSEDSAKLTTFITPFGRFCFTRLPFGISSAPEIFQRIMHELLSDIDGVTVYMDDIVVSGANVAEHDGRLDRVLERIEQSGLKLNQDKCVFKQPSLNFLGHYIDANGVQPSREKVEAIVHLQAPENVAELRRCLGMVNYLGRYINNLASLAKPLNDLLRKDTAWAWGPQQERAFDKIKKVLTTAPTLAYFDPSKPVIVSADSSSYGLGAVLLQKHGNKEHPVAFTSRTLTDSERRYAQIEKECLASVVACEKFAQYLVGLQSFELQTDHKPLVPLMNSKDLDKVPVRCQRLLMRMMRFNPKVVYVPGKDLAVADALSRAPMDKLSQSDKVLAEDVQLYVDSVETGYLSQTSLAEIRRETAKDLQLQAVIQHTLGGWPKYSQEVPESLGKFHSIRNHLSVSDGLLLYDDRIYVPRVLQDTVLERIHDGHQGIVKCRERAKSAVFWIGISEAIKDKVDSCEFCQRHRKSQPHEPLKPSPLPDRPWEKVAMDLYDYHGVIYIIVVDYFSRFIETLRLFDTTSRGTIFRVKDVFARWGIPQTVVSDNGPQFSSQEFAKFASSYGFTHITTSPHFPQANGAVERAVQTAKSIIRQDDPHLGLMVYRSTPCATTGFSPAELIMGRKIRTTLPVLDKHLEPGWPDPAKLSQNDSTAKSRYKFYYDKRHGARHLPDLSDGTRVLVKTDSEKEWIPRGSVEKCPETPRSHVVSDPTGVNRSIRRNRKHLRPLKDSTISRPDVTPVPGVNVMSPVTPRVESPRVPKTSAVPPALTRPPDVVTRSGRTVKPVSKLDM